jgi:hypothetical protein
VQSADISIFGDGITVYIPAGLDIFIEHASLPEGGLYFGTIFQCIPAGLDMIIEEAGLP